MDDFNIVIVEELKSLNRKLERLGDKIDQEHEKYFRHLKELEDEVYDNLNPIKKHVTQVKFASVLLITFVPIAITAYNIFI